MISASASVGVPESSRVMMIGDLLLLHCDAGYVYSEISRYLDDLQYVHVRLRIHGCPKKAETKIHCTVS